MKKCSKCDQLNGVHKMSCETRKVTIMADITKCAGTSCKVKESCYRFTAKSSDRQSFFIKEPIDKDGKCNMYWKVKD